MDQTVLYYHTKPQPNTKRQTFTGIVDGTVISIGLSTCSLKDNFSKQRGRTISEGRAITKPIMVLSKSDGWRVSDFVLQCKSYAGELDESKMAVTSIN